ncbi:hypothetical protein CCR97_18880 [Rhodoplanes elegans]|uniref:Uncharacterized protein n=1 Tax=Rhodoplanes elegans TaxID=29408 RepID=A0A327KVP1_9BRAD|nr:hypothetical protein [Rhodoplanes elegans]RAI42277.1 hypothetical protein CH338_00565 [Rhodoplanes elegans]
MGCGIGRIQHAGVLLELPPQRRACELEDELPAARRIIGLGDHPFEKCGEIHHVARARTLHPVTSISYADARL